MDPVTLPKRTDFTVDVTLPVTGEAADGVRLFVNGDPSGDRPALGGTVSFPFAGGLTVTGIYALEACAYNGAGEGPRARATIAVIADQPPGPVTITVRIG